MRVALEGNHYDEIKEYILNIPKFAGKASFELTGEFYEFLGSPGKRQAIIHVAGTNGKGSVCTYMDAILRDAGNKVGVFTSPHLVSIRERFRIGQEYISREEFVSCFRKVADAVNAFDRYHPSFFEFLFFMGMVWFEDKNVDYIILETGLGGRLDATNVCKKPVLTVITKIGLDHCEYLGNTLEEIAGEKAGIIKKDVPLVCWDTSPEITEIFRECAKKKGTNVHYVTYSDISALKINENSIDFCVTYGYHSGVYGTKYRLTLPTVAAYQVENASLALLALLHIPGFCLEEGQVIAVLGRTVWEGRMEELSADFYVDGAHNPDGVRAFIHTLDLENVKESVLIFGVNRDKSYFTMLKELTDSGRFQSIILTRLRNERSADPLELFNQIQDSTTIEILTAQSTEEAYRLAQGRRNKNRIYAVGSLYLVGEYKELSREEML